MASPLTSVIVAFGLLLSGTASHAQYAYTRVEAPVVASTGTDTEETPNNTPDKKVHGVVQGKQGVLPGATVWLHGTRTIVVTNSEGEFELSVPANTKVVELTCGYGGLQEEVVRFAPAQAMGSIYLLRTKNADTVQAGSK
ncbi:peptidase associated/transthyretin-like domain-containing protein [Hymenobacter rubidus]|uniref:carboxypeptidase-like regulatory domain-containing protein n=1 Tax=Hymenobacter rubidus TaxID=1441626 RepID=UPI00191EDA37|nr:carboxypeptidase-like regulatory domain-containing protein [Hymenobacter rubidus]